MSRKKPHPTYKEITVITIAAILYLLVILYLLKCPKKWEARSVFGLLLFAFFFLLFFSFIVRVALKGMHQYKIKKHETHTNITVETKNNRFVFQIIKLVKFSLGILFLLGIGVFLLRFLFGFIAMSEIPMASSWVNLPLAEVKGIAVDQQGRIVCRSRFYLRMQTYDSQGNFLNSWFTPDPVGSHVVIDKNGRIRLADIDNEWFYDFDGNLLSRIEKDYDIKKFESDFGTRPDTKACDEEGNSYFIRNKHLFPKLVKVEPDGKETILVSSAWYLWLLQGPLATVLTWFGVAIPFFILDKLEKNMKKKI